MALLCMIFPAMIFCYVREKLYNKIFENKFDHVLYLLFEYFCGNAVINTIIIGIRVYWLHNSGNILDALSNYSDFALKYLILGVVLGIVLPYFEKYVREKVIITFDFKCQIKTLSEKTVNKLVYAYAVGVILLQLLRCFNNCIGGDEGLVVHAVRCSWSEMLTFVASNGHTPLHYAVAWALVQVFGESGFIYHISSALPYFAIILFAVTIVRKYFGNKVSVIFMTFCTFLESAVSYNFAVRMYGWAQLFILLAFFTLYGVYHTQKNRYYILFVIFSLGAVYSHYFALASIGVFGLILFAYTFFENRKELWKVIISGCSILILLLPWLLFAQNVRGAVISDYGIVQISYYACIEYIFHSKYSMLLLGCFFAVLGIQFCCDYHVIQLIEYENKKKITLSLPHGKITREWIWMLSGIIAAFGTIIAAEIFSELFYPIICIRYLYPAYIVIWLLYGKIMTNLKFSKLWTIVLVAFVLYSCFPNYVNTFQRERANNKKLETTLEITKAEIDVSDYIYTDIVHFAWTVCDVYYPGVPHNLFGHAEWWGPIRLTDLDAAAKDYWLFLGQEISEQVIEDLEVQDLEAELVVDNGFIGTGNVWVYKVVPMEAE